MKQSRFLMCPPTHFDVEYVINPWMEGQLNAANTQLASAQWSSFHSLMSNVADVQLMPPVHGLPDLVFYRQRRTYTPAFRYSQQLSASRASARVASLWGVACR